MCISIAPRAPAITGASQAGSLDPKEQTRFRLLSFLLSFSHHKTAILSTIRLCMLPRSTTIKPPQGSSLPLNVPNGVQFATFTAWRASFASGAFQEIEFSIDRSREKFRLETAATKTGSLKTSEKKEKAEKKKGKRKDFFGCNHRPSTLISDRARTSLPVAARYTENFCSGPTKENLAFSSTGLARSRIW